MTQQTERLDRNEQNDSLAAFMRAIKFRSPMRSKGTVDRTFAQPHPRARQAANDETSCIPSAN